jgi:hypothetical protein
MAVPLVVVVVTGCTLSPSAPPVYGPDAYKAEPEVNRSTLSAPSEAGKLLVETA